jgi:hypothetical protein
MRYGWKIANEEQGIVWIELIVAYFNRLFWHLPVWIWESDEKGVCIVDP